MIKLIITDLDGTLLDSNLTVSKEFDKVVKILRDHRVKFAIASGRPLYTIRNDFGHLENDIIFISDNGALITDKDTTLYSNYLEPNEVTEIIKIYRSLENVDIVLCAKDRAYIENSDEKFLSEVDKYYKEKEIVPDITDIKDPILKVSFCSFNNIDKITNKHFIPALKEKLQLSISGEFWLDIMDSKCNKGSALKRLQDKFIITNGETMAFGDHFNDIEMFKYAYYTYAMENAPEEVKKKARTIIGNNDDSSVINTIRKTLPDVFKH